MNERKLKRIVSDFRDGILGGRSSKDMCFAVCAPLDGWLSFLGFPCRMIEGEVGNSNHFWLETEGGKIIDPTADQFTGPNGEKLPKVFIGPKPDWFKIP